MINSFLKVANFASGISEAERAAKGGLGKIVGKLKGPVAGTVRSGSTNAYSHAAQMPQLHGDRTIKKLDANAAKKPAAAAPAAAKPAAKPAAKEPEGHVAKAHVWVKKNTGKAGAIGAVAAFGAGRMTADNKQGQY